MTTISSPSGDAMLGTTKLWSVAKGRLVRVQKYKVTGAQAQLK
jgi:hypothetical protein